MMKIGIEFYYTLVLKCGICICTTVAKFLGNEGWKMTKKVETGQKTALSKEKLLERLSKPITEEELSKLRGPLDIPMTNDYLFRALLQQNNRVLKALICALLHLNPESVQEISVENPIELGKSYEEKELILDIKALLNGNVIINLELQVVNEHNWKERSLCYLCRSFDNLNRGMDYSQIKPAVQIGILNFSLFQEFPEFYANYYMINEKTYHKYSDKFRLAVVDLTQIERATEEDREYKIDQWAKFFKCRDWSEVTMLARRNVDIQEAVGTVYRLSKEQQIRQQCEAREDYYKRERDRQKRDRLAEERERRIAEKEQQVEKKEQQVEKKEQQIEKDRQELVENQKELEQKKQELVQNKQSLAEWEERLKEKERELEKALQNISK